MQRKPFKSKLFKKKIKIEELDYWKFLYADVLYRLKMIKDLNCPCGSCFSERINLEHLLKRIEDENHIPPHPKATNFTRKGDCGRKLGPVA
jgi:hypothetical protein